MTTGSADASVTTPRPPAGSSPRPARRETPTPSAISNGTVTGPVVTPPESHARPMMAAVRGSRAAHQDSASSKGIAANRNGLRLHARRERKTPSATAIPTPAATAPTVSGTPALSR